MDLAGSVPLETEGMFFIIRSFFGQTSPHGGLTLVPCNHAPTRIVSFVVSQKCRQMLKSAGSKTVFPLITPNCALSSAIYQAQTR